LTSKKHRAISYFLAKVLTEACSLITGAVIFALGEYALVGYARTVAQLLRYGKLLVCCAVVGNSLGVGIGTVFRDGKLASVLTPLILMPMMIFSGVYNRLDSIAG